MYFLSSGVKGLRATTSNTHWKYKAKSVARILDSRSFKTRWWSSVLSELNSSLPWWREGKWVKCRTASHRVPSPPPERVHRYHVTIRTPILPWRRARLWPNGSPNSSHLEPGFQLGWTCASFGHPPGSSWPELDRVGLNLIKLKF